MKWLGYLITIILCVAFAAIGLLNSGKVPVNYIVGSIDLPLVAVMLLSFLFGALMILVLFGFKAFYWKQRAKSLLYRLEQDHAAAEKAAIQAQFHADQKAA
ncbi:LapA family protein [uncultured Cardiobacterium sp.]|uniref:LapA family protein n=1 Tax=uncultured Cardiobacterium sp. TaxID=417619 RepID=UPI002627004C|nr:LapA family protein [uncultured Cardiobacterium sp.]